MRAGTLSRLPVRHRWDPGGAHTRDGYDKERMAVPDAITDVKCGYSSASPEKQIPNGRTAEIDFIGDGWRERLAAIPAHTRSRQAGGSRRWPLPDHRFRALEPGEFGHPVGLRADAVQVAVARGARAAHLGIAQRARYLRHRGAGADAHGRILVPR